jgi:hypothetical protein
VSDLPFDPKRVGFPPAAVEAALSGLIEVTLRHIPASHRLEYLSEIADVLDTLTPRLAEAGETILFGAAADEAIYEEMRQALENVRASRGQGDGGTES